MHMDRNMWGQASRAVTMHLVSTVYRRSNHMSCRLDRLCPPTWRDFGLICGRSHNSDRAPRAGPLKIAWLCRPDRSADHLGSPTGSHSAAQTLKSSGFAAEGHQNHKMRVFPVLWFKSWPDDPKVALMMAARSLKWAKRDARAPEKWSNFDTFGMTWAHDRSGLAWVAPGSPPRAKNYEFDVNKHEFLNNIK